VGPRWIAAGKIQTILYHFESDAASPFFVSTFFSDLALANNPFFRKIPRVIAHILDFYF